MVFQYINMLKKSGPQEWIFEELQQMAKIDYDFLEEDDESDFVEGRFY